MSTLLGWFGIAVSAVSAGVAIYAVIISRRTQGRLLEIEESRERERLEEKDKAILVAQLVRQGTTRVRDRRALLRIENKGCCEARNIVVEIDGAPFLQHEIAFPNQSDPRVIGPGAHFDYQLITHDGTPPSIGVAIGWTDDSDEQGSYRTTLTF